MWNVACTMRQPSSLWHSLANAAIDLEAFGVRHSISRHGVDMQCARSVTLQLYDLMAMIAILRIVDSMVWVRGRVLCMGNK